MYFGIVTFVFSFILFANVLFAQMHTHALISEDFSSELGGWQPDIEFDNFSNAPWERSTTDGYSEDNSYMRMRMEGSNSDNSRFLAFNTGSDWTGDFIAKGVTAIALKLANFSATDTVYLRIAISNSNNPLQPGGTGTWWMSDDFIQYDPESGWSDASFKITESSMHRVTSLYDGIGTDSFEDTLSDIKEIRILSSQFSDSIPIGDHFAGIVGIDDIQLIEIPEPNMIPLILLTSIAAFYFKPKNLNNNN